MALYDRAEQHFAAVDGSGFVKSPASEGASYITGQTVNVDGGLIMS